MAAELQTFTRRMMEGVLADHAATTEHNPYCCQMAREYADRLGMETTPAAAPQTAPKPSETPAARVPAPRTDKPAVDASKPASDRQLDYIVSLGRRVGQSLISPQHREQLKVAREGGSLNRQEAADLIEALKAQTDERPRPASDRQIKFIHSLVKTKDWAGTIDFEKLTSATASDLIVELKAAPAKPKADDEVDVVHTPSSRYVPDEGYYFVDGTYYKVQDPKVNGGGRYASNWHPDAEKWNYAGQKYFRLLTQDKKLTAEQATAFGTLYGRCIVRGCPLTDAESIRRGYGPICAERMGWPL
jgi:hypothetical protein